MSNSMQTPLRENKMGVMPVGKLLLNMALPMIISMLVQALYNVVDSIYVSRISEDAVTVIMISAFLLVMSGVFNLLEKTGGVKIFI